MVQVVRDLRNLRILDAHIRRLCFDQRRPLQARQPSV